MQRKFETGMVVYLCSGGVPMTVSDPLNNDTNLVDVHWFDANGVLQRDLIHQDCLRTENGALKWERREALDAEEARGCLALLQDQKWCNDAGPVCLMQMAAYLDVYRATGRWPSFERRSRYQIENATFEQILADAAKYRDEQS